MRTERNGCPRPTSPSPSSAPARPHSIARAARRTRLVRVATVSLFAVAVLYAASWLILVAGGVWVSAALLVLFPIALQMGFVFIGGQAGRLLDVRQMKERFPRIVVGFSVGFLLGGLLGIPLLALLGSTENLLLGATAAQLAFVGLLLETERRFPEVRSAPAEASHEAATAVGTDAVRVGPRSSPPRLPVAVGDGLVARRLPPLQPRARALQRRRPDPVPVGVHGAAQPRRHPVPRAPCRSADASLRPATRTGAEPRRRRSAARSDGRGGRRAGRRRVRPLRACGRDPPRRHRPDRRHHPHVGQRLVPGGSDRGPPRSTGGRGRHRRSRGDRRHWCRAAAHEPPRPRDRRGDRLRCRPERGLDGERRGDVPVVHARARRRDETPPARRERVRCRRGRRRAASAAQVRRCA